MTAEKTVRICNRRGLHARAAARFVRLAEEHADAARVIVRKDGMEVCGTSIMGLLMLSGSIETEISIHATGAGAQAAVDALADLVARRFDEEA